MSHTGAVIPEAPPIAVVEPPTEKPEAPKAKRPAKRQRSSFAVDDTQQNHPLAPPPPQTALDFSFDKTNLPSGKTLAHYIERHTSDGNADKMTASHHWELTRGYIFPFRSDIHNLLNDPEDVAKLQGMLPAYPAPPPEMREVFALFDEYFRTGDPLTIRFTDAAKYPRDLFTYVLINVTHFHSTRDSLRFRQNEHSEGWVDVNIWATLIDHLFLRSEHLSVDRKELKSIADINSPSSYNYDGIIRNVTLINNTRLDLCFIEVKPSPRAPFLQPDDDADRSKVLRIMKGALADLIGRSKMKDGAGRLQVMGIVCRGTSVKLFALRKVYLEYWFFEEVSLAINLSSVEKMKTSLLGVLEALWTVKVALENTHTLIEEMEADNAGWRYGGR